MSAGNMAVLFWIKQAKSKTRKMFREEKLQKLSL